MSKFNVTSKGINQTVTYEGAPAIIPHLKERLVRQVLTTFVYEPKFYKSGTHEIHDLVLTIREAIAKDPRFVANLAVYARNELYMRSISHMIVAELAASIAGKPFVKRLLPLITHRPDDLKEILAYYLNVYGKPIPNSLKKGLAGSFTGFNEYQLAKYNSFNSEVKLKDILGIAHPRPKDQEQSNMWKRLLENNLTIPYTWETELAKKGNTKQVWEELINSEKVGYMALLRNLRNILKAEVDEITINKVIETLTDPVRVANSKQLPFRFFSAYSTVEDTSSFDSTKVLDGIAKALEISTQNLPVLNGKTFIAVDVSGSMTFTPISGKSTVRPSDIASLLGAVAHTMCEKVVCSAFATKFATITLPHNNSVISNMNKINHLDLGGGTDMSKVFQFLLDNKMVTDRIIILTDDQAMGYPRSTFEQYRKEYNPNTWLHLVDLAGYNKQQFYGDKVNYIAGWSEKILSFIPLVEKGENDLIKHIEYFAI